MGARCLSIVLTLTLFLALLFDVSYELLNFTVEIVTKLVQVVCHSAVSGMIHYLGQSHSVNARLLCNFSYRNSPLFCEFLISNELFQVITDHYFTQMIKKIIKRRL